MRLRRHLSPAGIVPDTEVASEIEVKLWAPSSAPDTAFTAKLRRASAERGLARRFRSERCGVALSLAFTVAGFLHAAIPLAETWQTGYIGKDAPGPHALGYWQFKPDAPMADSSGLGSELKLAGAVPLRA